MYRYLIILLFVLIASNTNSHSEPVNRRLFKNIKDGRIIQYLGNDHTKEEFKKIKRAELKKFTSDLKTTFNLKFKLRNTKYFNIAYRCTVKRMDHFQKYLTAFFIQIYPRFFKYELLHPIRVIYFENKEVYTNKTGSPAYGFYTPLTKTLTTYAFSGHGTLWHEMIHAFMDQNVECEVNEWFSEGLASFYEMAFLRRGKVVEGYTNWRMPYLQEVIKNNKISHLKNFMSDLYMRESYGYTQARFLFCYLWVNGKMDRFVNSYLYELCPKYSDKMLGQMSIKKMEELLGKEILLIHKEYIAMAKRVKKDQKLKMKRR